MMWAEEISEGAHVGTTTHQGAPGAAGAPGGLCPPGALPLMLFALKIQKYSEKNCIKFHSILRTFIVGSFFIAWKTQKTDKAGHFILFN